MERLIEHWRKISDEKWKTAESLIKSKRYADALFFCHLTLEAELKACFVEKNKQIAPYIHDLSKLAQSSSIELSKKLGDDLEEINTFNVRARYDNYKDSFYKKATKIYAEKYYKISKELKTWFRKN